VLIKRSDRQDQALKKTGEALGRFCRRKWPLLALFGAALACMVIVFSVYYGMILHKTGRARMFNELVKMAKASKLKTVPNYLKGLTANPKRISIDVNYKNFQKIVYKKEMALADGILMSTSEDYVPGNIRYGDKTVRIKLRLKGDLVDQLQGEKWSFRIVVKGDKTLFGMKVFSIHAPSARDYLYEWLLHKAMKREDVISLRYDFIDVTLNGKPLGVYALEEHFEKRLIENNRRREGVIVCYNEDVDIENINHFGWPTAKRVDFYGAEVDLYRPTKTLADPVLLEQFTAAKNLLELFRAGRLKTNKVFDVDAMGRYFALLDLFNARHAAKYGNFKFYYNPVTAKLEPICFDAECVGRKGIYGGGIFAENWYTDYLDAVPSMFKDPEFFESYMRNLMRISDPAYLDRFFSDIDNELYEKLKIIYSEFPHFYFDKDLFYSKQLYIKKAVDLPRYLNVYFKKYNEFGGIRSIDLAVGNIRPVPLRILNVNIPDKAKFLPGDTKKAVILYSIPGERVVTRDIGFIVPDYFEWKSEYLDNLHVEYVLLGQDKRRKAKVIPWPDIDRKFRKNDLARKAPNAHKFPFFSFDEPSKKIYIKNGQWDIVSDVIIPRGYRIVCRSGTQINLSGSAKIISYSLLDFMGREGDPIRISSEDSTGQGVAVIKAGGGSVLRNVVFDNLSSPSGQGWNLTGAVTFYESPVEIYHSQFSNSVSEDALNIIRTDFSIDKTLFKQSASDALDVDFSKGEITNSSFIESGNDAVDISGSVVALQDVFISGAGDKGLSAGENSNMSVFNIVIKDAEVAAASKDMSRLKIENATVTDCKNGFCVYQKKSEFGPASISVDALNINSVDSPYLVEEGSSLDVGGAAISVTDRDVVKRIYGEE
jgi:hypothetical protein|tara:strand:+ start:2115 stop:4751 length:2637 start_codon:yes stop_codon:yes gene_type:complete